MEKMTIADYCKREIASALESLRGTECNACQVPYFVKDLCGESAELVDNQKQFTLDWWEYVRHYASCNGGNALQSGYLSKVVKECVLKLMWECKQTIINQWFGKVKVDEFYIDMVKEEINKAELDCD